MGEPSIKKKKVKCVRCGKLEAEEKGSNYPGGWVCENCDAKFVREMVKEARRRGLKLQG